MHTMRQFVVMVPIAATLLVATGIAPTSSPPAAVPEPPGPQCVTSIGPPFALVLSAPEGVAPSALAEVRGSIRAQASLNDIEVTYTTDDGLGNRVQSIAPMRVDAIGAGEEAVFTVPFPANAEARRSVTVHVQTTAPGTSMVWERTESFYALMHKDRVYSGMGSFLQLEIQAIEAEYNQGLLTEEDAEAQTKALLQLPHTKTRPAGTAASSAGPAVPPSLVAALAHVPKSILPTNAPSTILGSCITIQGHIEWQDENGNWHPAFGLNVQIFDDDTIVDEFVDVVATNTNGDYYIEVDGDDGIGAGDRDVYVRVITANSAVSIEPAGIFTSPYQAESGVYDESPCGTQITEDFFFDNGDPNPAVNLCESGTWVAVYTADRLNGGSFLGQIVLEWPGSTGSANYDGSDINLRPGDRWDWDVLQHEYGHYIADTFNIENNPGGPHGLGDCVADVHNDKSEGIRLAWAEGWPTYNGTLAQAWFNLAALNVPRVGDVNYSDTGESSLSYSLEASDNLGVGEDNELATQRILWDFWDSASDGLDNVSLSDQTLFSRINGADPTTYSGAWAAIRGPMNDPDLLAFAAVNTEHFIGPDLNSPSNGAIVSPSNNNNFNWDRNVGCPSSYLGDGFSLRFFRADNSAPILTIAVGNVVSYSLTLAEIQSIVAVTHNVLWAVEGSHSGSPATGPYLGRNFAAIVNRPPVADAGTDITAECTSPTTTAVMLDGTASSDPDGDALTWSWTAPGVVFDNPNSSTPTGQFPFGATVVTLIVSDGIEQDTDQVLVTVVDTTPPEITCPAPVTVECSNHCLGGGTPADDPQLDLFFASVMATDVCDTEPVIGDDAPDCFPLGTTPVVFTATDSEGNAASCTTSVTVEDTTPPEIVVVLSRDALWPPNHKLADISAEVEVTDICDPNPTFELTSITSDEPDDGLGDGDTADDIQGDDLGTADVEFQLRSERAGVGDGRKYTIIYTASDESGNTTPDTTCVIVPHDQRGHAMSASGFIATGLALDPDAPRFSLVLPATPRFDPRAVDIAWALVGNSIGAVKPMASRFLDVTGDRVDDLVLDYSTSATLVVRSGSTRQDPIGLHFWGPAGAGYLVPDIFLLGAPVRVLVDAGAPEGVLPEDDGPDLPAEEDTDETILNNYGTLVLPDAGLVTVEVFTVTGHRIRTVATGEYPAGRHELAWDGRNEAGARVSAGMYIYRVRTASAVVTRKIILSR